MKQEKNRFHLKIILAIILIVIVGGFYIFSLINQQQIQTQNYLYEISKKEAAIIYQQLTGDIDSLKLIAGFISQEKEANKKEIKNIITQNQLNNNFYEIIIQLNNQNNYYINNKQINMNKVIDPNIAENIIKEIQIENQWYYLYQVPIYQKEEKIGTIVGIKTSDPIKKIMDTNIFKGEGYSQIISNMGEIIIRSNHINSNKIVNNIFEVNFKNDQEKNNIKNKLLQQKNGITNIIYDKDKIKKTMIYLPIGIENLFVATFVPTAIINQEFTRIILLSVILILSVATIILIFIFSINKNKEKNEKIILELAYVDELTKGYNKNKFILEANSLIKGIENKYAILNLNIKNFKTINELFGRKNGDYLLQYIYQIIKQNLTHKEIVGRARDDIFYILLEKKELKNRLNKIVKEIKEYTKINLLNYELFLNIGIYKITREDKNLDINYLIDRAIYATTKQAEINYYNYEIKQKIQNKNKIELEMQQALDNEEFIIYIQPKYDTQTEKIIGGEALIRWKKNNELIYPDKFIYIFEENNFIKKLDLYILKKIGIFQKQWNTEKNSKIKIAVNQSKKNIYDINYIKQVKQLIQQNNIPGELIEIELTENIFVENIDKVIEFEKAIHELNMTIAMDDFGVGYSTYELLQKINIDVLKLDKTFFNHIIENPKAQIIVKGIITMANELKIKTVAEGIETKEQVEFLKQIYCDQIQGYYFSKPIPIQEFKLLVDNQG